MSPRSDGEASFLFFERALEETSCRDSKESSFRPCEGPGPPRRPLLPPWGLDTRSSTRRGSRPQPGSRPVLSRPVRVVIPAHFAAKEMGPRLAEAASRAGAGRTWGLSESLRDELWAQSHPRRLTACSAAAGCWVGPETQPASHLLVSFGPWWEPGLCPRAAARSPGSVSAPARPAQCWVCVQRRGPPEASALCSVWRRGDCRGHRGARRFCTCDDVMGQSLFIKNSNDRNSNNKLFLLFPCLPRATLEAMARPALQVNG